MNLGNQYIVAKQTSSHIWNGYFKALYNNSHDPGDEADTVEDTEFFDGKEEEGYED